MVCSTRTQHTHPPHSSHITAPHTSPQLVSLGRDVDGWSCCIPRCWWRLPLPCPSPLQLLLSSLLEGPWPHCLALWRQSQQLKLHHTSGHHHGPHVHLSFLQEGIITILPQPRGRRHCVWLTLRGGVRCLLPLPLPLLFDTILLDEG